MGGVPATRLITCSRYACWLDYTTEAEQFGNGCLPTAEGETPIAAQSTGCVPQQPQSGAEGLEGSWRAAQSTLQG